MTIKDLLRKYDRVTVLWFIFTIWFILIGYFNENPLVDITWPYRVATWTVLCLLIARCLWLEKQASFLGEYLTLKLELADERSKQEYELERRRKK